MRNEIVQRTLRNKAEIQGTRYGRMRLRLELLALDVQVDLLVAEPESSAFNRRGSADERLQLPPQHLRVKPDARLFVGSGQDEVIEMTDHGQGRLYGLDGGPALPTSAMGKRFVWSRF